MEFWWGLRIKRSPLFFYGYLRQRLAAHFHATLQAYFLPAGVLGIISYYAKGLVTTKVNYYFLWLLTNGISTIFKDRSLNRRLNNACFFDICIGDCWGLGFC